MKSTKRWLALVLALVMCIGVLAGCGNNNTQTPANDPGTQTPANDPGTQTPDTPDPVEPVAAGYTEAPYLTNLGTYGNVEDRLPVADDIMVESVDAAGNPLAIGVYGGELKFSASSSNWATGKPIEEGLFRFNTSAEVEPNVAKSYEVNEDATVYTIHLREGMKWSDGEPFTAEDCVWFYNTVCLNKLDSKGVRNCHKDANGDPAVVEKVDDYTFTVTFGTPKYDFIETLIVDLKWHYAPKHVLEGICQDILDGKEAEAIAAAKELVGVEFADGASVGKELLYYFWNYRNIPTLNPFVLSNEPGKDSTKGEYYEYIRNPYYWKVDAAGQQLPYIDKIDYTAVQNTDQTLMLLLDGTVDIQTIAVQDAPTVLDAESTSGTKINLYEWSGVDWGSAAHQLHFNLFNGDEKKVELYNNPDFRQAVSICVDREALASALTDGWQEGGQAAPQEGALGYSEEWSKQWTEYDVEKAKSLLEGCGLVMGSDGFYDFADGTNLEINIVGEATLGAANTFALLDTYYRAVGLKFNFRDYDRSVLDNDIMAGNVECILYPITPIGDISIALKPNSMIPGYATNMVWYGTMKKENATGDLLELINLKEELDKTADAAARAEIVNEMLALHQKNQWTIGYIAATPTVHAVNDRVKNFPDGLVWSDIYRDLGIAHCQCWYIEE